MIEYRSATLDDVPEIGDVHVAAQRQAGEARELPESELDALRSRDWASWLSNTGPFARPVCARSIELATSDGAIVGFAAVRHGPTRFAEFNADLTGLFLLGEYQGRGIGRALVGRVAVWLAESDIHTMLVDVVEANPHAGFYAALGGEIVDSYHAGEPCVAYGFRDLRTLRG